MYFLNAIKPCTVKCGDQIVRRIATSSILLKRFKSPVFSFIMPKQKKTEGSDNKPEKEKLRHIRYREHVGGNLPTPKLIEVHVIGTGAGKTPRSFMINTSMERYLFNCGEGTQRISTEFKLKLTRLEHIFITHKSWANLGGMIGGVLTMQETSVPKVTFHGPPGVEAMVKQSRTFAAFNDIEIGKTEVESVHEDHILTVTPVPFFSDKPSETSTTYSAVSTSGESKEKDSKRQKLSPEAEFDMSVAYIIKPQRFARKVDFQRCLDLNLPRGPTIAKLKAGETVVLQDGREISPEQILFPEEPSPPILAVECPSPDFLDSLLQNEPLGNLQKATSPEDQVDLVVHLSSLRVMLEPRYQLWMNRFQPSTRHLILNETGGEVATMGVYRSQAMLNMIHADIFPLLPHQTLSEQQQHNLYRLSPVELPAMWKDQPNITIGETNLRYPLRSQGGFQNESCIKLDNKIFQDEVTSQKDFSQAFSELQHELKVMVKGGSTVNSEYPSILFLGTGSSVPSKVRNVSGILLQISEDECMALDYGEGSTAQIYRHFGEESDEIFRKLSCVFISHMHADHHLGVFGLLHARREAFAKIGKPVEPLIVLAPRHYRNWLNFYHHNMEPVKEEIRLESLQDLLPVNRVENASKHLMLREKLKLQEFIPVLVLHCQNAFGVVIKHESGWKLAYSGDTMPCPSFVNTGKGCDILIHEATMEDGLELEAYKKTHSTTSQAIDVGDQMGAGFILLNHFSQRYSKIPLISDKFTSRVGIAFDYMKVRLSDLPVLPLLKETLKCVFAKSYAEMEEKTEKRKADKEKNASGGRNSPERNPKGKKWEPSNKKQKLDVRKKVKGSSLETYSNNIPPKEMVNKATQDSNDNKLPSGESAEGNEKDSFTIKGYDSLASEAVDKVVDIGGSTVQDMDDVKTRTTDGVGDKKEQIV